MNKNFGFVSSLGTDFKGIRFLFESFNSKCFLMIGLDFSKCDFILLLLCSLLFLKSEMSDIVERFVLIVTLLFSVIILLLLKLFSTSGNSNDFLYWDILFILKSCSLQFFWDKLNKESN